jgi:uncharacterized membrane protein YdcZ (DUF606 family)
MSIQAIFWLGGVLRVFFVHVAVVTVSDLGIVISIVFVAWIGRSSLSSFIRRVLIFMGLSRRPLDMWPFGAL